MEKRSAGKVELEKVMKAASEQNASFARFNFMLHRIHQAKRRARLAREAMQKSAA